MSRTSRISLLVGVSLLALVCAAGQQVGVSPTYGQVEADIKAYVGKNVTWTGILASEYATTKAGRTEHMHVFIITPAPPAGSVNRFRVRLPEALQYPRGIGSILKITGTVSGAYRDGKGNESPELKDVSIAR
ncbi:MAG: hypothetical protein ABI811_10890 [Acidobacteriota bacterium]